MIVTVRVEFVGGEVSDGNVSVEVEERIGRALSRVIRNLVGSVVIGAGNRPGGKFRVGRVQVDVSVCQDRQPRAPVNNDRTGFVAVHDHVAAVNVLGNRAVFGAGIGADDGGGVAPRHFDIDRGLLRDLSLGGGAHNLGGHGGGPDGQPDLGGDRLVGKRRADRPLIYRL